MKIREHNLTDCDRQDKTCFVFFAALCSSVVPSVMQLPSSSGMRCMERFTYLFFQPGRSIVWMHCSGIATKILGVMSIQCINLVCRVPLCSRMSITEEHVGLL
jgi:hypothetical protein